MSVDLAGLDSSYRLLFAIPLTPLQGSRFQPTGFPSLGAATFETALGSSLLVESAQSMANRLEMTIWNDATQDLRSEVAGLSHVRVRQRGRFLTDTILESHRLNSPYLLEGSNKTFFNTLKEELGVLETGPVDRRLLAKALLKYDIGSLLHGVFVAKKELAGGRLRVARAMSAFIEADGVRVAASGGVKNDHVNPSGDTKTGFGNVPFARDEFTAERLTLYVNIDLAQVRGYGLGNDASGLLMLLALYKLRRLVDAGLRLRTACDLRVSADTIVATSPSHFVLPALLDLEVDLTASIRANASSMTVTEVQYDDELKKGKDKADNSADPVADAEDPDEDSEK
jgi:CRISPR-associated protein Csb1